MAKYVLDFDSLRNVISLLDNKIIKMESNLKTYNTNINNELSGWDSTSKKLFSEKNIKMIESINKSIEHVGKISSYLKEVVRKVENAESTLASKKL